MSLDPVDQKGASPYAYCANNPIKFTDPTGEVMSYSHIEEMFQVYGMWKEGQPRIMVGFGSEYGSMQSYMEANSWFYMEVALNEYISQMRFYFAKHDYFRQTYQYGSTTIETYMYFNPITMSVMVGMNRYDNPEYVAGSGAGLGSTYTVADEMNLMRTAYVNFMVANYPIHGSTIVPEYAIRYLAGDPNVWACADWSYELNAMFGSMNLQYWQTKVVNIWKVHSLVSATCYGEWTRYFDPYFMAPFLYGFQVFPPLPYR